MDTVFLYSGLGSHYCQMGRDLYQHDAYFRARVDRLDLVFENESGFSPLYEIYGDHRKRGEGFEDTMLSSASLFMIERALTETLIHHGVVPDVLVGASMGMYAATCASGAMDDVAVMRGIGRQGQTFGATCPAGFMAAVLGPQTLLDGVRPWARDVEVAGVYSDDHFILAGPSAIWMAIEADLKTQGVTFQRMSVAHAFHTRWIDGCKDAFFEYFEGFECRAPHKTLVSCASTKQVTDPSARTFWDDARGPILFQQTIQGLEASGPKRYIDVGPSGSLGNLARAAVAPSSRSTFHGVLSPFGADTRNMNKLLEAIYRA